VFSVDIFIFSKLPDNDINLSECLEAIVDIPEKIKVFILYESDIFVTQKNFSFVNPISCRGLTLGAKKQLAMSYFDGDYAIFMHPRIILPKDFLDFIVSKKILFDVFSPKVERSDGSRYLDLMHQHTINFFGIDCLLKIPDENCSSDSLYPGHDFSYLDGGFIGISKYSKDLGLSFDESRDWEQEEDVDLGRSAAMLNLRVGLLPLTIKSLTWRYEKRNLLFALVIRILVKLRIYFFIKLLLTCFKNVFKKYY